MLSTPIRLFALFALLAFTLHAAEGSVPLTYARFELSNGLKLRNVVIKNYDPKTDRFLLIADGKALTIPAAQIPQPFREALRKNAPAIGGTTAIVRTAPSTKAKAPIPPAPASNAAK